MKPLPWFFALLLWSGSLSLGFAQNLGNRVLVVYNTFSPPALTVAEHYRAQRNVPAGQLCGINFGHTEEISESVWLSTIRPAIRSCLDAAGRSNILYVVLSYGTPFRLARNASQVAALDSYIADIWDANSSAAFPSVPPNAHRYFDDAQSLGNVYAPFLSFAAFRAQPRTPVIYSVWRLDGATPTIASALVDKAIAAETNGWSGNVYLDRRFGPLFENLDGYDLSYFSGEIDLYQAGVIATRAGLNVVTDTNDAEFGTAPAPLTAPNAAFYSGWYSGNNYNNAFTWNQGAIGWHLDSASLLHPRQGANWSANALQQGITITSGSVAEPYLEGLAHPDVVLRHLLHGGNVGDAFLRGTAWLKWMVVNVGDPLYRPLPNGRAPFNVSPAPEDSLRFSPRLIYGGNPVTMTVQLANAAPVGGLTFSTRYLAPELISGPPTVTVPAGQRSTNFTVTTSPNVPRLSVPDIRLTQGSLVLRNTPLIVPILGAVSAFSADGTSVTTASGGASLTGRVYLYAPAPQGGAVVSLSSNHPAVQVPSSVVVPFGTVVSPSFTMTTSPVGAPTPVTITATFQGAAVTLDLTLLP